jgi:hypothetical protein
VKIIVCEQGSPEWHAARCGIPTASNFDKLVTSTGAPSKQAQGYLYALAAERITGRAVELQPSAAMEEGSRREEESRMVYSMIREVEVVQVGFCVDDSGRWGCSPDGLVGSEGLAEFKNPLGKTAVEYLVGGKLPTEYLLQVQGQLLVTCREWCDFVSYFPGLPTLVVRVPRDPALILALEKALDGFCKELDHLCEDLRGPAARFSKRMVV